MGNWRRRYAPTILVSIILAFVLVGATGCGAPQTSAPSDGTGEITAKDEGTQSTDAGSTESSEGVYDKALSGEGVVSTFIHEDFFDGKVTDADSALKAIESVKYRIGGDETTKLEIESQNVVEGGLSYYIFKQRAGDMLVHSACVKVIVNKDQKAIGLLSAILPDVKAPELEKWGVTQQQAEDAVRKHLEGEGVKDVDILSDASEQTIIPLEDVAEHYRYAWVVYTKNYLDDFEMAYLAHYINEDGDYLYAIPVVEPNNSEALSGDTANWDFDAMEAGEESFSVKLHDDSSKEITVPVLKEDEDSKNEILADPKRKILCADYAEYINNQNIVPCQSEDKSFDNYDLLAYETFIRVWDFFDAMGWKGPDSNGTPTLLLMNYVNAQGEPEDQAFYAGRQNGFQVFAFNHVNPDGENIDIIGHEFTHCVTGTTMTTNLYLNDYGAINEGMSDVIGNLVEMLVEDRPDGAWLLGEGSGEERTLRSMKDPHAYNQPEFAWDTYYAPTVLEATDLNDNGGVHINSSLLNIVSYKLNQAGMKPEEQRDFWMNVALAMTPRMDFPQMAEFLPWCMEQTEYPQYVDALKKAIEEAKYTVTTDPETLVAGSGAVKVEFTDEQLCKDGYVRVALVPSSGEGEIGSWPPIGSQTARVTAPAGEYYAAVIIAKDGEEQTLAYDGSGWSTADPEGLDEKSIVHIEDGKTLELPSV